MALFPECVPSHKKQRINLFRIRITSRRKVGRSNLTAMGVGAASQGYHFNFLKFDDLIGESSRTSKVEMMTAKNWLDGSRAFFSTFTRDHQDIIGTRYLFDDIYSHAESSIGSELFRYIRGAEEIIDGKLAPIFPEEHTLEEFIQLKKNKRNGLRTGQRSSSRFDRV